MQRLSINWEGDLIRSPNGDYVEYRDVVAMQEELDSLRKALKEVDRIAEERMQDIERQAKPAAAGARVFGWVNPNDARRFNSGKFEFCRVFKRQTDTFCMPVFNTLGPNHYQKPDPGVIVKVNGGVEAVVISPVPEGLLVEAANGDRAVARKWSLKR